MQSLWRTVKRVLRSPFTPPLLVVFLAAHAAWIAHSTNDILRQSQLGALIRQKVSDFGPSREPPDYPGWRLATVIPVSPSSTRLITREEAERDGVDISGKVASLIYGGYESRDGFYAPTSARRESFLRVHSELGWDSPTLRHHIDEFIDLIASGTGDYRVAVRPRSEILRLKNPREAMVLNGGLSWGVTQTPAVFSGYLHNTLAGAALLALLISLPWSLCTIPGRIRRWRWKRAGACIHCGYDTTALPDAPRCPECGNAKIPSPREG